MSETLYIPDRVNVGYQERKDTYTGKLAYVIYWDHTGKLRKEKSWNSWRNDKIDPQEFANEPTEGFVLNKGVGGARASYGWNTRNEYIRVYDPRNFEFEISVSNLLFILRECDCSKGKGLEGSFVYAWSGTDLVLLPSISSDFEKCKAYTALQAVGVKSKELIAGATYETKRQEKLVYIGRFDHYEHLQGYYPRKKAGKSRKYIFHNGKSYEYLKDLKTIAKLDNETIVENYAELVDRYYKGPSGSKIVEFFLKDQTKKDKGRWFIQEGSRYLQCSSGTARIYNHNNGNKEVVKYTSDRSFGLDKDGIIDIYMDNRFWYPDEANDTEYRGRYNDYWHSHQTKFAMSPTGKQLWAKLESGSEFKVGTYGLYKVEQYGEEY